MSPKTDLGGWYSSILKEWERLLDGNHPEEYYHQFLSKHAGLFLSWHPSCPLVISKLKLGSRLVTDFVIIEDNY